VVEFLLNYYIVFFILFLGACMVIFRRAVSANTVLDVIEVVRTIKLELLNRSVEPLGKVMARVILYPTPITPSQVILLIQVGSNWTPITLDLITSDSR